jgi:predicted nucleotidyltransferase
MKASDLINKKQAIEIVKRFIDSDLQNEDWYQNIKEHLFAIILYGSVAKGLNRIDSDIDVLFILPLEIEEKYTKGEYFFQFEGRDVNIVMRSIERLRQIAKDKNDEFQKEIFRDAEITWSSDEEVEELLKSVKLGNEMYERNH